MFVIASDFPDQFVKKLTQLFLDKYKKTIDFSLCILYNIDR